MATCTYVLAARLERGRNDAVNLRGYQGGIKRDLGKLVARDPPRVFQRVASPEDSCFAEFVEDIR